MSAIKLFILSSFIFFSACQTLNTKVKTCENQCLAEFQYCKTICENSCPGCCASNRAQAIQSYKRYARECEVLGKPPIHLLQYYHDPLKCNKNTCSCEDDLLLCKQSCAGKILKRLKTFKYC